AQGCDEKPARTTPDAIASPPAIPSVTIDATPPPKASAAGGVDAGSDAGQARYDPKHKCPTGMTHFYLEGDFCRHKCSTQADCGKREHCSAIEYPFIMNGQPAGMSKFCEGI